MYRQLKYVEKNLAAMPHWTPVEQTPEMVISNIIAPLISQKAYSNDARAVMQKYNLDAGLIHF